MLPADAGEILLPLARSAIALALHQDAPAAGEARWLDDPGASFVTLTIGGRLRGCIGSLEAYRALGEDVASNARAAAFHDPRFAPVSASEYPDIDIEVSVLSPPEPMPVTSRADALAQLRPGADGLIVSEGRHRATFLPQIWEQLPSPDEFLRALLRKAGLPPEHWSGHLELARYTVQKWAEQ
ncbi:AmmeMemoRadiSam system protein A [Propionimicrobium sp. PCR01-08-3]|uniref:AmmeMemoRadiSam system protein A n=1 Tax=Propionimicrobium sp. PCR01-08-3 TaxID=3052086 RepID=UPI00255CA4E3|nr:AmmeMemoRadiSam system protein A [Propionimicrobium sp. PCR01-08-3]WIY82398.1 AmmeMemoRadiSam system protein A [Propionimicrobium sp. PCR01-08-3]